MTAAILAAALCAALAVASPDANAWGRDGHETVGALSQKLLKGSNTSARVDALLTQEGVPSLEDAGEWADCVKGLCGALTQQMEMYKQKNPKHDKYHYTDIPIQRKKYAASAIGADKLDIVHAMRNAILVLQDKPAEGTDHKFTKAEAMVLLAHLVGDLHQPLHVGAAYVNDEWEFFNPQNTADAKAGFTEGGNYLCHGSSNVHSYWDGSLVAMAMRTAKTSQPDDFAETLVADAEQVPVTVGAPEDWPAAWATESLRLAKLQLASLTVVEQRAKAKGRNKCAKNGPRAKEGYVWDVEYPDDYGRDGAVTARMQLAKAGARLSQLLKAVLP